MPKNYLIDRIDKIIWIHFNTYPKLTDIRNAIDDVSQMDQKFLKLWDFSRGINLENSQVEEIASYSKKRTTGPSKSAIVALQDLTYGLSRMYEVHRELEHQDTRAFRTKEEAILWLQKTI